MGNSTILTLQTALGEIDLLAEVAGVGTYEDARKNAIQVEAFDRQIFVLDLPALIQSKRAAGREKDLAALPELEALEEIDRESGN